MRTDYDDTQGGRKLIKTSQKLELLYPLLSGCVENLILNWSEPNNNSNS